MKVISNIGINWWSESGSTDRAKKLVDESLRAGVASVCVPYFQSDVFRDEDKREKVRKFEIGDDLLKELAKKVLRHSGVGFYVSPRHPDQIDYLENIDVSGYHIQNGDILHTPLLQAVAETRKPVYLSTGLATFAEVNDAVEILLRGEDPDEVDLVILHSTGGLPTDMYDANFRRVINLMQEFFPLYVGIESFLAVSFLDYVALGYNPIVIMRRIDLADKKGVETEYSLTPEQMKSLVSMASAMEKMINSDVNEDGLTKTEFEARDKMLRCKNSDWLIPPSI